MVRGYEVTLTNPRVGKWVHYVPGCSAYAARLIALWDARRMGLRDAQVLSVQRWDRS